jgi:hypothetical protein
MARSLQVKKISEAIKKAQRVGEVEEPFTVAGCSVVLRNLTNEEFEAVMQEVEDLEELQYVGAYKKGHLARSICEVNGESLREYDYVEVEIEEPDPRSPSLMVAKSIKLERHKFVHDYILSSWSREVIDTAWRKFNDVVAKSEKVSTEGVSFIVPDETPDEKYRRLLSEAKEVESSLPSDLQEKILGEVGYMLKTSQEEFDQVSEKLARVQPTEVQAPPQEVAPVEAPQVAKRVPLYAQVPQTPPTPKEPLERAVELPRKPFRETLEPDPEVLERAARSVSKPVERAVPTLDPSQVKSGRFREIGSLEGDLVIPQGAVQPEASTPYEVVELAPKLKLNPEEAASVFDAPPMGGINPRYRPPTRL